MVNAALFKYQYNVSMIHILISMKKIQLFKRCDRDIEDQKYCIMLDTMLLGICA